MPLRSPTSTPGTGQPSRLFFALLPDPATREAIYSATRAAVEAVQGRPTPSHNLHVTLAFLGHLPAEALPQARAAAGEVSARPFSLVLDQLGHWPGAKVIWLGCTAVAEGAVALALELRQRLQARSLPFDRNKFTLHMTMARWVRNPGTLAGIAPIRWQVREFALVNSVTRETGVEYSPLATYALSSGGVVK